jgi:hypothetical protein
MAEPALIGKLWPWTMPPLTARLFSSPLTGLGLGLMLVSRASDWRAAPIPAVGICTTGIVVLLAFALGHPDFAPRTTLAWAVAATPVAAGAAILLSRGANPTVRGAPPA